MPPIRLLRSRARPRTTSTSSLASRNELLYDFSLVVLGCQWVQSSELLVSMRAPKAWWMVAALCGCDGESAETVISKVVV